MEKLTRDKFNEKTSFWLLAIALATVPFTRFLMLPIAILLMIVFLTDNLYISHFKTIRKERLLLPFFITVSLFFLCIIGTIYSANVPKAISDWECKLWFLAAPLGLLPLCGKFSLRQLRTLMIIFCLSVTATAIGNFVISAAKFATTGDVSQFFYLKATHFFGQKGTHPSYLSMYSAVAWLIAVTLMADKEAVEAKSVRRALVAVIVILPLEIILLQSKAGLLIFAIVFVSAIVHAVRRRAIPLWAGVTVLAACVAIGVAGVSGKLSQSNRLTDMRQQLRADERANPYNGTLQRIAVWETSCELAGDNLPFGTGTGDITDELCERYEAKGYTYILEKRLNCHNQYLQCLVGLGIPGLLALLLFIGISLWEAVRQKEFLQGIWWFVIAGNLLVESMLETRAGSNFIPLMTMLLLLYGRTKQTTGASTQSSL